MPPAPKWRASWGPSRNTAKNAGHMLRVIRNHRAAAYGKVAGYDEVNVAPVPLDHANIPVEGLGELAKSAWDEALALGEKHGFRNAQSTVIAPTGTIGLVMDCDTTGIEPDFALVKFKKLAGGGYFKIINRSVPAALDSLGLRVGPDRGNRRPCRRPCQPRQLPRHQPHLADRPRLRPARDREDRGGPAVAPSTSSSSSTSGRWVRASAAKPLGYRKKSWPTPPSTCSATSASPRRRSTRRTTMSAGR